MKLKFGIKESCCYRYRNRAFHRSHQRSGSFRHHSQYRPAVQSRCPDIFLGRIRTYRRRSHRPDRAMLWVMRSSTEAYGGAGCSRMLFSVS